MNFWPLSILNHFYFDNPGFTHFIVQINKFIILHLLCYLEEQKLLQIVYILFNKTLNAIFFQFFSNNVLGANNKSASEHFLSFSLRKNRILFFNYSQLVFQ